MSVEEDELALIKADGWAITVQEVPGGTSVKAVKGLVTIYADSIWSLRRQIREYDGRW